MSLLIEDATLDGETATIGAEDGEISFVAREAEEPAFGRAGADRVIDASGLHAFPSMRNAHTHAAMTLFRGWGDDLPLMTWLQERVWPAEEQMTAGDVYRGTRLALLEMIRTGTTWFNEMYWHA
ncbi:MAG: amidohydrolase family protein, partial [Gemmatimonadota bacterium]